MITPLAGGGDTLHRRLLPVHAQRRTSLVPRFCAHLLLGGTSICLLCQPAVTTRIEGHVLAKPCAFPCLANTALRIFGRVRPCRPAPPCGQHDRRPNLGSSATTFHALRAMSMQ